MANSINWGKAAIKNVINWGKARFVASIIYPNAYGWGATYEKSYRGETNIVGVGQEMQKNNYYVYILEQEGGNYLRDRIDGEFWLDDTTRVFNYWSNATSYNPPVGSKSYYGTSDTGWLGIFGSLDGSNWWGCGMYVYTPALPYGVSGDYKFHIAFRVQERVPRTEKFTLGVGGIGDTVGEVTIASTQSGLSADYTFEWGTSEWHAIEIPFSLLQSRGMVSSGTMENQNYLYFKGDAGSSAKLEIDAAYWYNPSAQF